MAIIIIESHAARPIDPRAIQQLYASVKWWPDRQSDEIAAMLDQDIALGAWDGEHLVGFVRVVSDGRFRAYIEDVVVHPGYQRRGIGTQLVANLAEALGHIETVSLFCEPDLLPFYEGFGFRARRSQIVMHRTGS